MSLPSHSIKNKDWIYENFGIDYLKTREAYLQKVMPLRIRLFQKLIRENNPKIVVFYSFKYLEKWKEIIGCELSKKNNFYHCKKDETNFFVIPHPVAYGMTNNDWNEIAQSIKQISSKYH